MRKLSPQRKKTEWFKFVSYYDRKAKKVIELSDGQAVVFSRTIPPDDDVAICMVPTSITHEQGLGLSKILEAHLNKAPLMLTNNIQFVRLERITAKEAKRINEGEQADVISISAGEAVQN